MVRLYAFDIWSLFFHLFKLFGYCRTPEKLKRVEVDMRRQKKDYGTKHIKARWQSPSEIDTWESFEENTPQCKSDRERLLLSADIYMSKKLWGLNATKAERIFGINMLISSWGEKNPNHAKSIERLRKYLTADISDEKFKKFEEMIFKFYEGE